MQEEFVRFYVLKCYERLVELSSRDAVTPVEVQATQRSKENRAAQAAREVSRSAEKRQVERLKRTDWPRRQLRLKWWKRLRRKVGKSKQFISC